MFSKKSYIHVGNRLEDQLNIEKKVNQGNAENHKDTDRKHSETKEPELRPNQ